MAVRKQYEQLVMTSTNLGTGVQKLLDVVTKTLTDLKVETEQECKKLNIKSQRYGIKSSENPCITYSDVNHFNYKEMEIILFQPKPSQKCLGFKLEESKGCYLGFVAPAKPSSKNKYQHKNFTTSVILPNNGVSLEVTPRLCELIEEFMEVVFDFIRSETKWREELFKNKASIRKESMCSGIQTLPFGGISPMTPPNINGNMGGVHTFGFDGFVYGITLPADYNDSKSTLPKLINDIKGGIVSTLLREARLYYILGTTNHTFSSSDIQLYLDNTLNHFTNEMTLKMVMDFLKEAYINYKLLGGKN